MKIIGRLGLTIALLAAPLATAQQPERPAAPADKPSVTRSDLARSYLRLEQAYIAEVLDDERRAEINQAFDRATLSFFLGRFGDALRTIDTLALALEVDDPTALVRVVSSWKVQCEPPVLLVGSAVEPQVSITSLYAVEIEPSETLACEVNLLAADGKTIASWPLTIEADAKTVVDRRLPLDLSKLSFPLLPGTTCTLEVAFSSSEPLVVGRWPVTRRSFDQLRKENAERLKGLMLEGTELDEAWSICRARNELLTDVPSTSHSAQFLADPNELAASLAEEIDMLANGENPYRGRWGDYWRVLHVGPTSIPLRVFAPETTNLEHPRPLWIVLHGAGGDENMFLDAYGAGRIKQLAREHDCVVASPLTYSLGSRPDNVAALIDSIARHYSIDRSRVYLIGHSMGAGAASSLATSCRDQLAAVCCIAGGRGFKSDAGSAPTLVIVPELDAIVPPKVVAAAAGAAREAGADVELRVLPDYGHTLVVGEVLPDVVEWLLEHRLTDEGT